MIHQDFDWTSFDDVADDDDDTGDDDIDPQVVVGLSAVAAEKIIKQSVVNVVSLDVTATNPTFLSHVEVGYKLSTDSVYTTLATGPVGMFELVSPQDDLYDFRARGFSASGRPGAYVYATDISATGAAAAPSDVTNFNANVVGSSLSLIWDPVSDLDLSHYTIRHSIDPVTASWANSTTVEEKISRPASSWQIPARAGVFHIRAYDKTGLASVNYTSVTIDANEIIGFTNSPTAVEHTSFSGTKTDCSVTSNELRITDPSSGPSIATYEFNNVIDTGSARIARLRIDADVIRIDNSSGDWDDIPGNWDSFPGLWDDWTGTAQFADTNIIFYVATTTDDPNSSPTWGPWRRFRSGDFYGRGFKFKVELTSDSDDVTPSIKALTAYAEYN